MTGVLILNKSAGMTSHDAVQAVRRLYGVKKAGHTGTLDPNATGVLPVLVGGAVKASEFLTADGKVYRARLRFGLSTDTEDIWGKVTEKDGKKPSREAFEAAVAAFPHDYDQVPPMVSALKVGGKRLYEYARMGVTVPREARRVTVYTIECLSFEGEEAAICVSCSRGTYIRTLITDLCRMAGATGVMSALERESCGAFSLSDAADLGALGAMTPEERAARLLPVEDLFRDLPRLEAGDFTRRLLQNGQTVLLKKHFGPAKVPCGLVRLFGGEGFFALGEVSESEEGKTLKKRKSFDN